MSIRLEGPEWINCCQAAWVLEVSHRRLRDWRQDGVISSYIRFSRPFYQLSDVERVLNALRDGREVAGEEVH